MARLALWAGLCQGLLPAGAQTQPPPTEPKGQSKLAQIDRNGVLILIRTTLLALNQANETGNYTVLRDLSAPGFREANTAARLGEIFAAQRGQKLDLSGAAVLDPQLTLLPQIEPNGLLRMAGFFPSIPVQINFELLFAPVDGRWRPFGISVSVSSSTPTAPAPPAPPSAAKGPDKPKAASKPAPPQQNKPKPAKPDEPAAGDP